MFISYVTRRLLSIIPALFFLSLLVFILKSAMPLQLVEDRVNTARLQNPLLSETEFKEIIKTIRSEMYLDRPMFYFSVVSGVLPDTLSKIFPREKADFYKNLLLKYGSVSEVSQYYHMLERAMDSPQETTRTLARSLMGKIHEDEIRLVFDDTSRRQSDLNKAFQSMVRNASSRSLIPSLRWHGSDNQFHYWLSSLLRLDLGNSIVDNQPVSLKLTRSLGRTLLITVPAFIALVLLSIPLGIWLASSSGKISSLIKTLLFGLDALPLFWLALLLIILFASNFFLNWFPAYGMSAFSPGSDYNFGTQVKYLVLPVVSLVLSSIGYITIQVMKAMNDEMGKLYVLAGRARGLSEARIKWVHMFRNSLVPVITIFSDFVTATFAGSLVVEVMFSIPGMGKLLFDSVLGRDFNVVLGVILFIGAIKMVINLLADLSYRIAKPSVSYSI